MTRQSVCCCITEELKFGGSRLHCEVRYHTKWLCCSLRWLGNGLFQWAIFKIFNFTAFIKDLFNYSCNAMLRNFVLQEAMHFIKKSIWEFLTVFLKNTKGIPVRSSSYFPGSLDIFLEESLKEIVKESLQNI